MRVYVKPQKGLSKAMDRIAKGLTEGIDSITAVEDISEAEVVLIHTIGYPETVDAIARCKMRKQKIVLAQYCLRTTQEPKTTAWIPLWRECDVVWSYYDLPSLCGEDGCDWPSNVQFVMTPLGCDPNVFYPIPGLEGVKKTYLIASSGYVQQTECLAEINRAVDLNSGQQFHLGPNLGMPNCYWQNGLDDYTLCSFYNSCQYVAGLRRIEGYEMPVVEGLLCGARPIVFDRPHYRRWFNEFAVFIPEGTVREVTQALTAVLAQPAQPVTLAERQLALRRFSWPTIARTVWAAAVTPARPQAAPQGSPAARKPRILYVGDAGVSSGFAHAAHRGYLAEVHKHYDVHCLGINYIGDPHDWPYKIYPCHDYHGGDPFGTYRLPKMIKKLKPDVLFIQQDPWNIPAYFSMLQSAKVQPPPAIGAVAVDGLNARGRALRALQKVVFWTEFGRREAINAGYEGETDVIPLGVDTAIYKPMPKAEARKILGIPQEGFIVGNVNRNQPRKRLDLTIAYFAEWVNTYGIDDAYLYLHVAPTGDRGYDVEQLMAFYGIQHRLILSEPEVGHGISERGMAATYNAFDVQVSTTQGEGFGLTTLEGMACGIPQIVPDWAALGEWATAALRVPCIRERIVTPDNINAIGGIASSLAFIEALHSVYSDPRLQAQMVQNSLELARGVQFDWDVIADSWLDTIGSFIEAHVKGEKEAVLV
jgi:D-inositol-3-phosphate glycosyltransferase